MAQFLAGAPAAAAAAPAAPVAVGVNVRRKLTDGLRQMGAHNADPPIERVGNGVKFNGVRVTYANGSLTAGGRLLQQLAAEKRIHLNLEAHAGTGLPRAMGSVRSGGARAVAATRADGREITLARRSRGGDGQVALRPTAAGQVFLGQPLERYLAHIPGRVVVHNRRMRNGQHVNEYIMPEEIRGGETRLFIPVTDERILVQLRRTPAGDDIQNLRDKVRTASSLREKEQAFRDLVGAFVMEHGERVTTTNGQVVYIFASESDSGRRIVHAYDPQDPRAFRIDLQAPSATGEMQTWLDRVVRGTVTEAEDMWMKGHLVAETRWDSGVCSVQVLVNSASQKYKPGKHHADKHAITAEQAAQELMRIALDEFPDHELAVEFNEMCLTDPVTGKDASRNVQRVRLAIADALGDNAIALADWVEPMRRKLRGGAKDIKWIMQQSKDHMPKVGGESLAKALSRTFSVIQGSYDKAFVGPKEDFMTRCTMKPEDRYLAFFLTFPMDFGTDGIRVWDAEDDASVFKATSSEIDAKNALEAIRAKGTPMRLIMRWHEKMGIAVRVFNGPRFLDTFGDVGEQVLVLNLWSNHVFSYDSEVGKFCNTARPRLTETPEVRLPKFYDEEKRILYTDMRPLDVEDLKKCLQAKKSQTFFIEYDVAFKTAMKDITARVDHEFLPRYSSNGRDLVSLYFPVVKKKRGTVAVRIRQLPKERDLLHQFCQVVERMFDLKLCYYGDSFASLADRFFREVLVTRRPSQAAQLAKKLALYDEQGGKCKICGNHMGDRDETGRYEADHSKPIVESAWADGALLPDRVICTSPCHAEETEKLESAGTSRHKNDIRGLLPPAMAELFRTIQVPRQRIGCIDPALRERLVKIGTAVNCVDIRESRPRWLKERVRPYPVGCPLDEWTPFDRQLFDRHRQQVEHGDKNAVIYEWLWVDDVPLLAHDLYHGAGIYPFETVARLVLEGHLSDSDIPCGWIPKQTRPSNELRTAFMKMRMAWEAIADGDCTKCSGACSCAKCMTKKMQLSMIGLWNQQEHVDVKWRTTDCEADMNGQVYLHSFDEEGVHRMGCKTRVIDVINLLPLSLQVRFGEVRLMYLGKRALRSYECPRSGRLGLPLIGENTDGIYVDADPDILEEAMRDSTYAISGDHVWQVKTGESPNRIPKGEQLDTVPAKQTRPNFQRTWTEFKESDGREPLQQWLTARGHVFDPEHDFRQLAVAVAKANTCSVMVEGAAGTGKTWWVRDFEKACKVEFQESDGLDPVRAWLKEQDVEFGVDEDFEQLMVKVKKARRMIKKCGYTHCCAALFGAHTIARLLYLQENLRNNIFVVDEMGLVPTATWGLLARYVLLGASFVLLGDWCGQFEPFGDRYKGLGGVEDSALMHELCGGVRIRLETYMRGTDQALYDHYYGFYDRGEEELPAMIRESVERYPARGRGAPTRSSICLVLQHVQRLEINRLVNEAVKPDSAVHCAVPAGFRASNAITMQPQDMYIWRDLVLLGCARGVSKKTCENANDIVQGVAYRVKEVSDTHATLWMTKEFGGAHDPEIDDTDAATVTADLPWETCEADPWLSGEETEAAAEEEDAVPEDAKSVAGRPVKLEVPLKDIPLLFRLMHAMCYYTSQGRTFRDDVFLCDVDRMRGSYGKRALIVGLSRATHGDSVHVVENQDEFLRDLQLRRASG